MTLEGIGSHGRVTLTERSPGHRSTFLLPETIPGGVTRGTQTLPRFAVKQVPRLESLADGAFHLRAEGRTRTLHPRDSLGRALRFRRARVEVALCRRGTDWLTHHVSPLCGCGSYYSGALAPLCASDVGIVGRIIGNPLDP